MRGSFEAGDAETESQGLRLSRREMLMVSGSAAALPAVMSGALPAHAAPEVTLMQVEFTINGQKRRVEVDPRQSVLDLLRETLDLTGTKKGCNQGACGACTVLIDGRRVNACLTLAVMHEGAEIQTIEGLADGASLHPLQKAFIKCEGLQCGYCTSGQIMSGVACIAEGHAGSSQEIQFWMSGNICRCGAYPGIVAAIAETAARRA
jgi:xanthine dehydrogenase YagT iron-sulfur-binding subunit